MKYFIISLLFVTTLFATDISIIKDYLKNAKIDKIITKDTFTIFYSYKYKQPIYTVDKIGPSIDMNKYPRNKYCRFKDDDTIPTTYRSYLKDYKDSGYDRGHISSYLSSGFTLKGAKDSCLLTNMSPQTPHFNRGIWKHVEMSVRKIAKTKNIKVVTVVFFDNNPWNDKFLEVGQKLQIPDGFAKIVLYEDKVIKYWFLEHR